MQGSLATKLRVLRAERGLTLRQAGELAQVRAATLSDIEHGRSRPQDITLAKLARAYNVPVAELLEEPVPLGEAPKGRNSEVLPGLTSAELRHAPRETMPLDEVVSGERLAAFDREINRLYDQLQAGEIDMPTYKARLFAEHKALFAAIDRASTEAG